MLDKVMFEAPEKKQAEVVEIVDELIVEAFGRLSCPRDLKHFLEFPFFPIAPTKKGERFISHDGKSWVEVMVNPLVGRATMDDKEILVYCISMLVQMLDSSRIPRTAGNVNLTIDVQKMFSDIRRSCGRIGDNSTVFKRLKATGNRLTATRISTNLAFGKSGEDYVDYMQFVERFTLYKAPDKSIKLRIRLGDWIWQAISSTDKPLEFLSLGNEYWGMYPFQRRLYEIIRPRMGLHDKRGNSRHAVEKILYLELRNLIGVSKRTPHSKFVALVEKACGVKRKKQDGEGNIVPVSRGRRPKIASKTPITGSLHIWSIFFKPDGLVVINDERMRAS